MTKDGRKVPAADRSILDRSRSCFANCRRKLFNKRTLHKRLPILRWLPMYTSEDAICDLVAGISVGLTVIPQALAYAGIAGLPVAVRAELSPKLTEIYNSGSFQYGLYSSFAGCFVYIFLGSCKDVPLGPSAIIALLTFQVAQGSWQISVLLCLMCGVLELAMGLLGLGFLIDFVSGPVASGFTSAVSLIILSSQIQNVLGIKANGNTFVELWKQVFLNIQDSRPTDTLLGITCIVVLLMLRMLSSYRIGPELDEQHSRCQRVANKLFWIVGTARNAILVIVCCIMGYLLHSEQHGTPFCIVGEIPPGLPSVQWPPTSLSANETTDGEPQDFFDMVHSIGSGLIVIPLISLMESIAIAKAFGESLVNSPSQIQIPSQITSIIFSLWPAHRCLTGAYCYRHSQHSEFLHARLPRNRRLESGSCQQCQWSTHST